MRRAARVDRNQKEIVDALRKIGCSVACTHTIGQGFPDIVVGAHGQNFLVEIKDGLLSPSKKELTPDEEKFHSLWRGQISIIESVHQALELVRR